VWINSVLLIFWKKTPPLTLENLIGFDLSLNIHYIGKQLLDPVDGNIRDAKARENIRKRLAGLLLLRAAYGMDMELIDCRSVDESEEAALLKKKDAAEMRKLVYEAGEGKIDRKGR